MTSTIRPFLVSLSSVVTALALLTTGAYAAPRPPAPFFKKLGNHQHPIQTDSELAQRYFDQGLTLCYGFNHKEAIRSFRAVATVDTNCAMAYWGVAYAYGPNINSPMSEAAGKEAWKALQQAVALRDHASPREKAYIDSLAKRYQAEPAQDRSALDVAYMNAMRELSKAYPDDLDAGVFYAEAIMDTMPWSYWTAELQPKALTTELLAVLQEILRAHPTHPGANHLYIHAVEAGPHPESGLPSADRLVRTVPGSGHLVHMPSHIYVRVGFYDLASKVNEEAVAADQNYISHCKASGFYPGMYYPHNLHFLWYSKSLEGRSADSLAAARKVSQYASAPLCGNTEVVEAPRLRHLPLIVWARFGRWQEILQSAKPEPQFPMDLAMWHYACGLASLGRHQFHNQAGEHLKELSRIIETPEAKALENPAFPATKVFAMAKTILAAKFAGVGGKTNEMFELYRTALRMEKEIPYMEPPYWYYPVRLSLGAALLETGDAQGAEKAFRESLAQQPGDGWGLFGLHQSLLKQGDAQGAAAVQERFKHAWRNADVQPKLAWY